MEEFWHFFENLNECAYVSDMDSYELVYMNRKMREMCGMPSEKDYAGKKCFEVIQHSSMPCSMCNCSTLSPDKFCEWSYYNPIFDKNFSIKDSVIEENGRRYRIELAIDISPEDWRSKDRHVHEKLEALANETLRIALRKETPDESIAVFLEYLGKALGGERTYIFERNEKGNDDNTYEWVAQGVEPMKDTLQDLPAEVCANWYREFSEDRIIRIKDLEDIRETDPLQYENLKRQDIYSIFVVPLYINGNVFGFYGVDNPSGKYIDSVSYILQMMAHYIVFAIRQRQLMDNLRNEERERAEFFFRQQIAQALAERTQENLDTVNEIIGSGLWYMDFDESGEMTRVFWSDTFIKMLGFKGRSEFPDLLESWSDRLHPDDKERTLNAYWDCVAGKGSYNVKYRLLKKNGDYNWFHAKGKVARHENGAPRLFLGTFINITEELQAQQALEDAYDAANRANAAKTAFLANMSHDIRTPLNAIIGMTAIASTGIGDASKVQHCLDQIKTSSEHLLYLVNDILDMNKIESGKVSLNICPFDIGELADSFVKTAAILAADREQKLNVNIGDITHPKVIGDCERIRQCFMNFLSNAVKYTPYGGEISFSLSEKATNHKERACFEFVFEDNGIGMSEEFIPKIFDPFTRADDHRAASQQGTGLGMPITKNIIQMMNGDIKVESTLNKGSRFTSSIFLKINGTGVRSSDGSRTGKESLEDFKRTDFTSKRILLAEDNDINAEIAMEILSMTGVLVDHVWNGMEAYDTIRSSPDNYYDMVLMDIQMPVMDGYESTKKIRSSDNDYLKTIPIIAVSANAFAEDVQRSKAKGMNEHIAKPIDFDTLLNVLNKYL